MAELNVSSSAHRLSALMGATPRRVLRSMLPALSLVLIMIGIAWLNPRAISYFGFTLMLNLAIPIALATIAQMFVMTGMSRRDAQTAGEGGVGCVCRRY